jgi:hypothetical protein
VGYGGELGPGRAEEEGKEGGAASLQQRSAKATRAVRQLLSVSRSARKNSAEEKRSMEGARRGTRGSRGSKVGCARASSAVEWQSSLKK